MERAPDWCKDVGPVQVQTVDREDGELHNCSAALLMLPFCNMDRQARHYVLLMSN